MNRYFRFIRRHLELIFWLAALILLFAVSPAATHFTLCPLSNLGFDFCPGCGLGHAVHFAMWLDFGRSFSCHPLGIMALIIIVYRIIQLTYSYYKISLS